MIPNKPSYKQGNPNCEVKVIERWYRRIYLQYQTNLKLVGDYAITVSQVTALSYCFLCVLVFGQKRKPFFTQRHLWHAQGPCWFFILEINALRPLPTRQITIYNANEVYVEIVKQRNAVPKYWIRQAQHTHPKQSDALQERENYNINGMKKNWIK